MDKQTAIALIRGGVDANNSSQIWADLGCGKGTFTLALAELLDERSIIYALDKDQIALEAIPVSSSGVSIQKYPMDFISDQISFRDLDGILMANSLHYTDRKLALLNKIHACMRLNGNLIIIEYEALYANPMVPFPVKRHELLELMDMTGFINNTDIGKMRSKYGHTIYSVHGRKS